MTVASPPAFLTPPRGAGARGSAPGAAAGPGRVRLRRHAVEHPARPMGGAHHPGGPAGAAPDGRDATASAWRSCPAGNRATSRSGPAWAASSTWATTAWNAGSLARRARIETMIVSHGDVPPQYGRMAEHLAATLPVLIPEPWLVVEREASGGGLPLPLRAGRARGRPAGAGRGGDAGPRRAARALSGAARPGTATARRTGQGRRHALAARRAPAGRGLHARRRRQRRRGVSCPAGRPRVGGDRRAGDRRSRAGGDTGQRARRRGRGARVTQRRRAFPGRPRAGARAPGPDRRLRGRRPPSGPRRRPPS